MRPTVMMTRSGILFDLADPKPGMVKIEDIASALSRQARFGGHTVALVTEADFAIARSKAIVPKRFALAALVASGWKAYLGPITTPVVDLLSGIQGSLIRDHMDKIQDVICTALGVYDLHPVPECVRLATKAVDATIIRDHMPGGLTPWWTPWLEAAEAMPGEVYWEWNPRVAESSFLRRYRELTGDATPSAA